MEYRSIDTEIGEILLGGENGLLQEVLFSKQVLGDHFSKGPFNLKAFEEAAKQIQAYLAGKLKKFNFPSNPILKPFQKEVLNKVLKIPYGEVKSYGEIAHALGKPGASRAVGAANARNPLPIVIPCHRVIGSSGRLTGYVGGEKIKRYLLELESPQGLLL